MTTMGKSSWQNLMIVSDGAVIDMFEPLGKDLDGFATSVDVTVCPACVEEALPSSYYFPLSVAHLHGACRTC